MRWSEMTGYPIPSSGLEPNLPIKLAQSNVVLLVNYTPIYIYIIISMYIYLYMSM